MGDATMQAFQGAEWHKRWREQLDAECRGDVPLPEPTNSCTQSGGRHIMNTPQLESIWIESNAAFSDTTERRVLRVDFDNDRHYQVPIDHPYDGRAVAAALREMAKVLSADPRVQEGTRGLAISDLRMAPWTDHGGCPIREHDRIEAPNGESAVVVFLENESQPDSQWRVRFDDRDSYSELVPLTRLINATGLGGRKGVRVVANRQG